MRTPIVTAVVLLLVASVSFAGVYPTVTYLGTPTGLTGYTAWLLTLNSDSGKITAIDGAAYKYASSVDENENVTYSITDTYPLVSGLKKGVWIWNDSGSFSQVGADPTQNVFSTIKSPTSGNMLRTDTHFAFSTTTAIASDGTAYNDADCLSASFTISPDAQATSLPIAYTVLPNGAQCSFAFQVSTADAALPFSVWYQPPEPTTLGMLLLSGLGLFHRRRHK